MSESTGVVREPYPIKARQLEVVRVEELSPDMRRIVLTGDDLEPELPYRPMAPADHVKVLLPDEATGELVLPPMGERGPLRPEGGGPALRDYTIRAVDPGRRELTLDFVLHDHGPAGRWAIAARPGARIGVLGPRGSTIYPAEHARYLIGADETALPAAERWIAEAPAGATVEVVVLVRDASSERPLPDRPGLRLRWLHRSAGDDLAGALIQAVPTDDGDTYVWAAAEAGSITPLRRHLRDLGLPRERVDVHGYWKSGEAGHHEPHGPEGARGAGRPGPGGGRGPGGRSGRRPGDDGGADGASRDASTTGTGTTRAEPGDEHRPAVVVPDDRRHLLDDPHHGVLAVRRADGSIIVTPMWFAPQADGTIRFTHTTRRGKYRALMADPHLTLLVVSRTNPNEYLELRGVLAGVEPDPEGAFFETLARRYGLWNGRPPSDVANRVVLVMRVEQVTEG
ncbi:MAG TPA: TIGR03618 family F420-dependent PPOX class oxidoreductase [Cellulomonas sp.]